MKVILWGINYSPEATGIAPFNAELAEYLARQDFDISVVTGFSYYPHWRKSPADRWRLFRTERINGVKVFRCAQYVPSKVSTVRRIVHELSFGLSSLLRVLVLPRANLYIVISPPLFLGACAWIVTLLKRSRFVFHVQDLQPGAAVGLGMVKGRGFIRALYALERFAYRHAAAVSGISGGMMDELQRKGVPAQKRIYFPNWLRTTSPFAAWRGEFRRRFDIPSDHLLAVYSGNLGRKQGIDILLETAQRLDGAPVTLVIAGAGAEREGLVERVAAQNLPNLRLLPLLEDAEYALMLADADVGLITQASGTGQYFFPSKLLTLLQVGLPVATVADADSELARAVGEGGFGLNIQPGQSGELATVLLRMASDPDFRKRLRERTNWVQRFSPSFVLPQFTHQLEQIVIPDTGHPPEVVVEREPSGV
jgi:colanic acid biosynthesis glycosyl transferase WcaI